MELFCSNRLCIDTVMMAFTGQSENLHILAELFPLDNLYLEGKTLLLVRDMLFNFGDILPETNKSSVCWDMGGNPHLTWLFSDSLYAPADIELEVESSLLPLVYYPATPAHLSGRPSRCVCPRPLEASHAVAE